MTGSRLPGLLLFGILMLGSAPGNCQSDSLAASPPRMVDILRQNEIAGEEGASEASDAPGVSASGDVASPSDGVTRNASATGKDGIGSSAQGEPARDEALFLLQFRHELVSDFAAHLRATLGKAQERLEVLSSQRGLDPGATVATESLRGYLQTSRRLARATPNLLASMFAGTLGPSDAHGTLASLEEAAVPRHVLFEKADIRLDIELLRAKLARTITLEEALAEQIQQVQKQQSPGQSPGPGER